MSTVGHTESERLALIKQTLADLEKHGHNCDWGREADLKWCVGEIERLRKIADERIFARMLASAHMRLNRIEPALRTIIEQHDKDGCIAAGAFDAGRDALTDDPETLQK